LENRLKNKRFLIELKYLFHLLGFLYFIYTLLGVLEIDAVVISYFAHIAIIPWIVFIQLSFRFKYCYVHRLPLYYILMNEIVNVTDNYFNILKYYYSPLVVYSLITIVIILGYSVYYIKNLNAHKLFKIQNSNKTEI
jgi:hypothetical protein